MSDTNWPRGLMSGGPVFPKAPRLAEARLISGVDGFRPLPLQDEVVSSNSLILELAANAVAYSPPLRPLAPNGRTRSTEWNGSASPSKLEIT
jgi:hypothetical protein